MTSTQAFACSCVDLVSYKPCLEMNLVLFVVVDIFSYRGTEQQSNGV
jgi:hypothetical protein